MLMRYLILLLINTSGVSPLILKTPQGDLKSPQGMSISETGKRNSHKDDKMVVLVELGQEESCGSFSECKAAVKSDRFQQDFIQ